MSRSLLLFALLAFPAAAQAQIINDDAWISGKFGAGTANPGARLEVQASSLTTTVFQVSGVDQTPFLAVYSSGAVGMGNGTVRQEYSTKFMAHKMARSVRGETSGLMSRRAGIVPGLRNLCLASNGGSLLSK